MRYGLAVCVALVAAVLPVSQAAAAPSARLTAQDRREIGVLLDTFVKDAVRRENLPAAWKLLGPGLSGGTTRAAWNDGKGVTVEFFPAKGDDFRTAWTGAPIAPGDVIVAMTLHADAAHPHTPQTAFKAEVMKRGGRWIVNGFYPAAQFFGGGHVEGPADFGARGGGVSVGADNARIGAHWFVVGVSVLGGLLVAIPLALWIRARRRARRAYRMYLQSVDVSPKRLAER
jgi:hypothetical protein